MNNSGHYFFCLFVFFLFACTQDTGKKGRIAGKESVGTELGRSDNEQAIFQEAEDFEQFIQKFSTQESFQLKRIKFPISVIIPNEENEGMAPMEETISKYEWEILDLTYDHTYMTRAIDQYYQGIRFRNDTAIVEIRGINNGIFADYYFVLMENRWYLVTLYEASF